MTHQLINGFLNDLQEKGYSSNTIRAYKSALAPLGQYNITELTARDLMIIMGRDWGNATAASRQSTFRRFYKWLQKKGIVDYDPTEILGPVQMTPAKRQCISEEDMRAILSEIEKAPLEVKVFFELLRDTDIQIEDLLKLNVEDIKFRLNTAFIKTDEGFVTVKNSNLLELCCRQKNGPLFVSSRGNRANYHWAYRWWKRINKNPQYTINQFKKSQKETC